MLSGISVSVRVSRSLITETEVVVVLIALEYVTYNGGTIRRRWVGAVDVVEVSRSGADRVFNPSYINYRAFKPTENSHTYVPILL